MKTLTLLIGSLLMLLPAALCGADEKPDTPADYRIQPGDTLEVGRWDEEESVREVLVSPEGNMAYPLAGSIPVRGLSLSEAEASLAAHLREAHVRRPRITITLKAAATKPPQPTQVRLPVFVLGAVCKPGTYEAFEGMRVRDAVGLAGGLAPDADGAHAVVNGSQKGVTPVDLERLLATGDAATNLPLAGGDMLMVPRQHSREALTVFVLGQVNRPGSVVLPSGSRLSDAAMAAGGPTPAAALSKSTLARSKVNLPVDLDALLRKGDLSANVPLVDGDVLLVPEAPHFEVTLVGEFQRPGSYPFREGARVTDALVAGGGPTPAGDLLTVVLRRAEKEIAIDLDALVKQGDLKENRLLQDGDVLRIPSGTPIYAYGGVQRPGALYVKRDTQLIDVLMQAGGPVPRADLAKAGVVRVIAGKATIVPLNIKDAVERGGVGRSFVWAQGDVLVIPVKGEPFQWQNILGAVSSLVWVGNLLR